MPLRSLLFSIFYVVLALCLPPGLKAQRDIGVEWDIPYSGPEVSARLEQFHAMGIRYLEVNHIPDLSVWNKADELGFNVYGTLPINFPIVNTFADPDSIFLSQIKNYVSGYTNRGSVTALRIFRYGAISKPAFARSLKPYVNQIRRVFPGKIYYQTNRVSTSGADSLLDFKLLAIHVGKDYLQGHRENFFADSHTGAYLYVPSDEMYSQLRPVKWVLEQTAHDSLPLFFKASWLKHIIQKYPAFKKIISQYASTQDALFPLPNEHIPITSSHSLLILILLLVWISVGLNYYLSPVYRKSVFRYFTGHVFFVEDVRQRIIRSAVFGTVILLQHILLTGIVVCALSSVLFSQLGIQAVITHYPVLHFIDNPLYSIFLWTIILSFLIEIICPVWLLICNNQLVQIDQAVNLYAWPLHINLMIGTIIITLLNAKSSPILILSLGMIYFLIFIGAFIIAALDSSNYLHNKKALMLAVTTGPYVIFLIAILIWIFADTSLINTMGLAISLS